MRLPCGGPAGRVQFSAKQFSVARFYVVRAWGSVLSRRGVSPPIQGSVFGGRLFLGRCPWLGKARLVEAALRESRRECSVYPVGRECSEFRQAVFSGSILCNAGLGFRAPKEGC